MNQVVVVVENRFMYNNKEMHNNCNSSCYGIICDSCKKLLEFNPIPAYTLFEQELIFDINLNVLEQQFFKLQKICHPDNFVKDNPNQQLLAQQYSVYINDCYKKLQNPYTRAIELLKNLDNNIQLKQKNDESLLLYIIELREELEYLNTKVELKSFKVHIYNLQKETIYKINTSFKNKKYDELPYLINKLSYLDKVFKDIKQKIKSIRNIKT